MFRTTRRVEFRDTDAAGIVHFSAFFPMMESAEHEFLRSRGISVWPRPSRPPSAGQASIERSGPDSADELRVTWPRVSAKCDYQAAAHFEDLLEIELSVGKMGDSSIHYQFQFCRGSTDIARGTLVAVCCRLEAGKLTKVSIPAALREKLGS